MARKKKRPKEKPWIETFTLAPEEHPFNFLFLPENHLIFRRLANALWEDFVSSQKQDTAA